MTDVFVDGDRTDAVSNDMSAGRILDVFDMSANVCLNGGIFEHTVAGLVKSAVFEYEVLCVA